MGGRWEAGQYSCPAYVCDWDDGENDPLHVIGFVLLAVDRPVGKSAGVTSRQTKLSFEGIWEKSPPRKVSKHNTYASVPKTDTGGLVEQTKANG